MELFLFFRALIFVGTKHICPCCGWRLRAFTKGGMSFKLRSHGYCPRCNSKARHRRNWLFLMEKTNLFTENQFLFHISPKYSLSRQLRKKSNLKYFAVDVKKRLNMNAKMDITDCGLHSNSVDSIICIHVL